MPNPPAPATGDLTDIASVTGYLQTSPNLALSPYEVATLLPQLITTASQFIRTYLGRNIILSQYTEYRDGMDPSVLLPTWVFLNYPVTAVQQVMIDGQPIPPATVPPTIGGTVTGYYADAQRIIILGYWVPYRPMCLYLQYFAGYETVPLDLDQACVELVAWEYRERKRLGITAESASGIGSRTYSTALAMLPRTQLCLERYTNKTPVQGFSPFNN